MSDDPLAGYSASLEAKTGKSLAAWTGLARAWGLAKHNEIIARLKTEHGLSHGYANTIALKARGSDAGSIDDAALYEQMFAGPKAAIRPLFDAVIEAATALGADVELAPKKGYVSLRRKKQFGLVQPSTKDRIDLGLVLKGDPPTGRLEAAGSFNAMVTHRVRLTNADQVDADLAAWLKAAYERAG